jgi:acyl carrier protein
MKKIGLLLFALLMLCGTTTFTANASERETVRANIEERFGAVLRDQFGDNLPELSNGTDLRQDLGADDLDIIELGMALEEYFDIIIADAQLAEVTTIESAIDLIIEIKNSRGW